MEKSKDRHSQPLPKDHQDAAVASEQLEKPRAKEPYEPPAIIAEEVFESLALTCGKHQGFACRIGGGGLNS